MSKSCSLESFSPSIFFFFLAECKVTQYGCLISRFGKLRTQALLWRESSYTRRFLYFYLQLKQTMSATYYNKFKSTNIGGGILNCSLDQDPATLELDLETQQTITDP
jgi:hypothetical protein